jgi:hypothetical protein
MPIVQVRELADVLKKYADICPESWVKVSTSRKSRPIQPGEDCVIKKVVDGVRVPEGFGPDAAWEILYLVIEPVDD